MSATLIGGPTISPTSEKKNRLSCSIRAIDNGYLVNLNKDTTTGYETAEVAVTSLPKLLKAIGTFFKEEEEVE